MFTAPAADKNAPLADAAPESPRPSRASFASDSHSSLYWTLAQVQVLVNASIEDSTLTC